MKDKKRPVVLINCRLKNVPLAITVTLIIQNWIIIVKIFSFQSFYIIIYDIVSKNILKDGKKSTHENHG